MKSKTSKAKGAASRTKRSAGSQQRVVRALRRALRFIRDNMDSHIGDRGEDVSQYPECFCVRCIAVRALRPNAPHELPANGDSRQPKTL